MVYYNRLAYIDNDEGTTATNVLNLTFFNELLLQIECFLTTDIYASQMYNSTRMQVNDDWIHLVKDH